MTPNRMNPPALPNAAQLGYSQISVASAGRLAFVSGQVALTPALDAPPDTLVEQTGLAVENCMAALQSLGAAPRDIAMMRIYVVDLTPERMQELWPVVLEFLGGEMPSVTGIGVASLAAPAYQIEIEMTVSVPE